MDTGTPTRRFTAVQYLEFQPSSEWKEDEGSNVLLVYVPEFKKEEMKITYIHESRCVKVVGERPLGSSKWSRFTQTYAVPQNCEVSRIHGKYQNGVLTITMPKSTIAKPAPKQDIITKPTQQPPQSPQATQPQKPPSTSTGKEEKDVKSMSSESTQKATIDSKKLVEAPEESKFEKGQDQAPPKLAPSRDTIQHKDEKIVLPSDKPVEESIGKKEKSEEYVKPKEMVEEKVNSLEDEESSKKRKESMKEESEENSKKRKESITDHVESAGGEKTAEKENRWGDDKFGGRPGEDKPIKEDLEKVKKVRNVDVAAAQKSSAAKGFEMELSEEGQALVNMGVAVLVIVALGAYISYKYGSSRGAQN